MKRKSRPSRLHKRHEARSERRPRARLDRRFGGRSPWRPTFELLEERAMLALPSADAGGPYSVDEGAFVGLHGMGSDPDGDEVTFVWDLDGDGRFGEPFGEEDGIYGDESGPNPVFRARDASTDKDLEGPSERIVRLRVYTCTDSGGFIPVSICDVFTEDTATINVLDLPRLLKDIHPIGHASPHSFTDVAGVAHFSAVCLVKLVSPNECYEPSKDEVLLPPTGFRWGVFREGTLVQLFGEVNQSGPVPQELAGVGGTLFFSAPSLSGRELWTNHGFVKDINPGTGDSNPRQITDVGGVAFFTADDGEHGVELWKSDGTAGGTVLVKDIAPGTGSPDIQSLTSVGGVLFFTAVDETGRELWKSDGTEVGTVRVKDIRPGFLNGTIPLGSLPAWLTAVGGTLFFSATTDTSGNELWKSDGTEAGTVLVKNIQPDGINFANGSVPTNLFDFDGVLFFSATDSNGRELWRSDGTEEGTTRVKDINPGSAFSSPEQLVNAGGTLYFAATHAATGRELYKSDGTEEGTVLVRDINTSTISGGSSAPNQLTAVGNLVFFTAFSTPGGLGLWRSDGTAARTVPLDLTFEEVFEDFTVVHRATGPQFLTSVGTSVYFVACDCSSLGLHPESGRPLATGLEPWVVRVLPDDPPSAAEVEHLLLPLFMAQQADEGRVLPASDAWWALRSQRNMALDEPVSNVTHLGAHNSFNSLNEGIGINHFEGFPATPNQILSVTAQLDLGARLLDLDIHDQDGPLRLRHADGPDLVKDALPGGIPVDPILSDIRAWLDRPENQQELILLFIQDETEQTEGQATEKLIPKLNATFGSSIYTPAERAADDGWLSRRELAARGDRVIIFHNRSRSSFPASPDNDGRFGFPYLTTDSNGHEWHYVAPRGAENPLAVSIAFRAEGDSNPFPFLGSHRQQTVNTLADNGFQDTFPEDANSFFSMTSDGLGLFPVNTTRRAAPHDVARAVEANINIIKMDFLFGDDEDAELGSNIPDFYHFPECLLNPLLAPVCGLFAINDDMFEMEQGNRVRRLESAVWSWVKDDPAVDRQMFQDVLPGDGTGEALRQHFLSLLPPATVDGLTAIGAEARDNGRDFAVQMTGSSRWQSVTAAGGVDSLSQPHVFALRSLERNDSGEFEWKVSTFRGTRDQGSQIPPSELVDENGETFVFAGPVNGFQNQQLFAARAAAGVLDEPIWINVNDADRDGNWTEESQQPPRPPVSVWTGLSTESVLWSDPDNWQGKAAPLPGDDLIFPASAIHFTGTNDLPADAVFRSITIEGGDYVLDGNPLILGDGGFVVRNTVDTTEEFPFIVTKLSLGTLQEKLLIDVQQPEAVLEISGLVSGAGGVQKIGDGTLIFSGANTYAGVTQVEDGLVQVQNDQALGTTDGGTVVFPDATLALAGGVTVVDESLTFTGGVNPESAAGLTGTLLSQFGINVWDGTVGYIEQDNLYKSVVIQDSLEIRGNISGPGGLQKTGDGTLILAGDNTYAGLTEVKEGVLNVQSNTGTGSPDMETIVYAGARLELEGISRFGEVLTVGVQNPDEPVPEEPEEQLVVIAIIGVLLGFLLPAVQNVDTAPVEINVDPDSLVEIGELSGPGDIRKTGLGTLILSGANTYTGATRIEEGVLHIENDQALGAADAGTQVFAGARLELHGIREISEAVEATLPVDELPDTSLLDALIGVFADVVEAVTSWIGLFKLADNVDIHVAPGTVFEIPGEISGPGDLLKTGDGTLVLAGDNSYTGVTEVQEGVLNVRSDSGTGSADVGTVVYAGAQLELEGISRFGEVLTVGVQNPDEPVPEDPEEQLVVLAIIAILIGLLVPAVQSVDAAPVEINVDPDSLVEIGELSGPGDIRKTGAGTLILSGANTYTGLTQVEGGTLVLQHDLALGSTAAGTELRGGTTLVYEGGITVDENVTLVGNPPGSRSPGVRITSTGDNTQNGKLSANPDMLVTVPEGTFTMAGVIDGPDDLTKEGAGTLLLTADNTLTGIIHLLDGTLLVDGSQPSAPIHMQGGALGGTGLLGPITVSGGEILGHVMQANPGDPSRTDLVVGGTAADDTILFLTSWWSPGVSVVVNGVSQGEFSPTGSIVAYGLAGHDVIASVGSGSGSAWFAGGEGNDLLLGGGGDDVLLGGDGHDLLLGGAGRDLLIGGEGADVLVGTSDDDILIAGTTAFDAHVEAIAALMAEWTSPRDYTTRVANLRGNGTGPRLNDSVFLKASGPDATLFDDDERDLLTGGSGRDWFFASLDGPIRDAVTDSNGIELIDLMS